ncbi:MAG: D-2-hydroxyacid dehydrogenase [Lachnospiraceae bacterium]|nr:D-2-hydroxyacid dehydrogenase [Lachnospiraceae bacterium]
MILIATPIPDEYMPVLEAAAPGMEFRRVDHRAATAEDVKDAEIIFGNVRSALLPEAKKLKLLQLFSAGFDNYMDAEVPEGCAICSAVGSYGVSVGEYAVTALMSLNRKFQLYIRNQEKNLWRHEGAVKSIYGSTILVLGAGSIGGAAARAFKAMGATVIGTRRSLDNKPEWLDELHLLSEIDELLPRADAVLIALPANPDTYRLFDKARLLRMKENACIVNVGRGNIIDCAALAEVLKERPLMGACLDVTDPEPLPEDHPLWGLTNVIITPHAAGGFALPETLRRLTNIAAENIRNCLEGRPYRNQING